MDDIEIKRSKLLKTKIFELIIIPVFVFTFFIILADLFLTMLGGGSGWFWETIFIIEFLIIIFLEVRRYLLVNKRIRIIMIIYNSLIILNVILFVLNKELIMVAIVTLIIALIMFAITFCINDIDKNQNKKTNKKNK